jgi:hypothetical protein
MQIHPLSAAALAALLSCAPAGQAIEPVFDNVAVNRSASP